MNDLSKTASYSSAGDLALSAFQATHLSKLPKLPLTLLFQLDNIPVDMLPTIRAAETPKTSLRAPVSTNRPRLFVTLKKNTERVIQSSQPLALSDRAIKSWSSKIVRMYCVRALIMKIDIFKVAHQKQLAHGLLNKFKLQYPAASVAEIEIAANAIGEQLASLLYQDGQAWQMDVNSHLGEGGNAIVLTGKTITGLSTEPQTVAIKSIKFTGDKKRDNDLRAEALTEFQLLQAINSPAFPKAYALIESEDKNQLYLVMDKINGSKFGSSSCNSDLKNPQHLHQTITSLLEAMESLTDAGIYHGDIKPDNMMFTPIVDETTLEVTQGAVTVFDLGSASQLQQLRIADPSDMPCSPGFEPPEVLDHDFSRGPIEIDNQATNSYALGVTINCLLHLVSDPTETNDHSPRQPTSAEKDFMAALLHTDPKQRIGYAQALHLWNQLSLI